MKKYTPVKRTRSQISTQFASIDEFNKFLIENPQYENGGMSFPRSGGTGLGVTLNEVRDIISFGNEFDRFEFIQTNTEYEIIESVTYQGRPAVWVKLKNK